MKVAFKIPPNLDTITPLYLVIEVSEYEISFVVLSKITNSILGFYLYILEKNNELDFYSVELKNIVQLENTLQQKFETVHINYNFKESTLIPLLYFKESEKENICNVMFGNNIDTVCFSENIVNREIKNVYRVPKNIYSCLKELYPKNKFWHTTTLQLQKQNTLECIVFSKTIKIILIKENIVQIVQYCNYETPSDVCYYLLNVCERFGVSTTLAALNLSGTVEEKSNLYKEIYKYFLNISFTTLPVDFNVSDNLKEIPQHFFCNTINNFTCV
ncbi:MAG: DUF3822 family protein [Ferruginibacter sp.]|nr:DUF3822 family protein [Ferruginibacter sp.]